jgi:hypothetical protein
VVASAFLSPPLASCLDTLILLSDGTRAYRLQGTDFILSTADVLSMLMRSGRGGGDGAEGEEEEEDEEDAAQSGGGGDDSEDEMGTYRRGEPVPRRDDDVVMG